MKKEKTEKLKVAYLLGSLNRGGTETLLLDVLKSADKAGFDMFFAHRKGGSLKDDFYRFAEMAGKEIQCLAPRFPYDPLYLWQLRKLLLRKGVQIVHAQQRIDCQYAWIATRGTDISVVQTFHGFDYMGGKSARRLVKRSIGKANVNVFVSEYERQEYVKAFPAAMAAVKSRVVYNGIDFSKIESPQATFEEASPAIEIGTVGNFVAVRQQIFLCRFALSLKSADIPFRLYFVGRRNEKESWRYDECARFCEENGLTDCVHFMGSRNDVPQLLAKWDAFVYATDHDTFGIAVAEAIASGLPVFANDHPVMQEISHNGEWVNLYRSGDVDDLVARFKDYLAQRETYKHQAVISADAVRKAYDMTRHFEALSNIYDAL